MGEAKVVKEVKPPGPERVQFHCEQCRTHQPVILEPIKAHDLDPHAWGDIVCKRCKFVIATMSAEKPGRLVFVTEEEIAKGMSTRAGWTMADKAKPPDLIFLQLDDDGIPEIHCADRINDSDVEYVRLDVIKDAFQPLLDSLTEILPTAKILFDAAAKAGAEVDDD